MLCSSRNVDDVVIGAPFVLTNDLITSLNIKKVFHVKNTEEDKVLEEFCCIDQYEVAREKGMVVEVTIEDDFYNMTTEKLA